MKNRKYVGVFINSFLDRLEGIEHDLSYLESCIPERKERILTAKESLQRVKDNIKLIDNHDRSILQEQGL